ARCGECQKRRSRLHLLPEQGQRSKASVSMALACVGSKQPAVQQQRKWLLSISQRDDPITEQRQACLQITVEQRQIEQRLATGKRREILDQQSLSARPGLPVQASTRIAGLPRSESPVIVDTASLCAAALLFIVRQSLN